MFLESPKTKKTMPESIFPAVQSQDQLSTPASDPSLRVGNTDRREPTPEELEAYTHLKDAVEEQMGRKDGHTLRLHGNEARPLELPETYEAEHDVLFGITRKLGGSLADIPRDVPMDQWGDYVDVAAPNFGQSAKANFRLSLFEPTSMHRADYEYGADGTISRTLFDSFHGGNIVDYQPLAPVSEVNLLSGTVPELVPSTNFFGRNDLDVASMIFSTPSAGFSGGFEGGFTGASLGGPSLSSGGEGFSGLSGGGLT